jgi:hypothetical protein
MSGEKVTESQQHSLESLAPNEGCSLPSPTRFKSLVMDLRQKLSDEVTASDCIDGADTILKQTMDDVACLSRLLRISEASLVEERSSSQAAQCVIKDLQNRLERVSNESNAHSNFVIQLKTELEHYKERNNELEHDVDLLREALCKSEAYRKEYAKSKKSELLDMQSKIDKAVAEAASLDAAHQRTRVLLLSEVETRSNTVNSMQRLEASHSELQAQHHNLQDVCSSQAQQLQVSLQRAALFTHLPVHDSQFF